MLRSRGKTTWALAFLVFFSLRGSFGAKCEGSSNGEVHYFQVSIFLTGLKSMCSNAELKSIGNFLQRDLHRFIDLVFDSAAVRQVVGSETYTKVCTQALEVREAQSVSVQEDDTTGDDYTDDWHDDTLSRELNEKKDRKTEMYQGKFVFKGGGRCRLCFSDDGDKRRLSSNIETTERMEALFRSLVIAPLPLALPSALPSSLSAPSAPPPSNLRAQPSGAPSSSSSQPSTLPSMIHKGQFVAKMEESGLHKFKFSKNNTIFESKAEKIIGDSLTLAVFRQYAGDSTHCFYKESPVLTVDLIEREKWKDAKPKCTQIGDIPQSK
mmetsp:Transcript_21109/g.30417  ORF Transcript_21109/g.30417 Transcript_21109/m.30417 type:complete len:323 (+) Transcript_21109:89-1057(+)